MILLSILLALGVIISVLLNDRTELKLEFWKFGFFFVFFYYFLIHGETTAEISVRLIMLFDVRISSAKLYHFKGSGYTAKSG